MDIPPLCDMTDQITFVTKDSKQSDVRHLDLILPQETSNTLSAKRVVAMDDGRFEDAKTGAASLKATSPNAFAPNDKQLPFYTGGNAMELVIRTRQPATDLKKETKRKIAELDVSSQLEKPSKKPTRGFGRRYESRVVNPVLECSERLFNQLNGQIPDLSQVAVGYQIDPSNDVHCVLKIAWNSSVRFPGRPVTAPPLPTPKSISQDGCQVMVPISGLSDLGLTTDPKIYLVEPAVPMKTSIDAVLKLNYFYLIQVEKPTANKTYYTYQGMGIQGQAYRVIVDEFVDSLGNKHVWVQIFNSGGCRYLPLPVPYNSLVPALREFM